MNILVKQDTQISIAIALLHLHSAGQTPNLSKKHLMICTLYNKNIQVVITITNEMLFLYKANIVLSLAISPVGIFELTNETS